MSTRLSLLKVDNQRLSSDAFRRHKKETLPCYELTQIYVITFNSFMTEVLIIQKSVHWFLYDRDLRHENIKDSTSNHFRMTTGAGKARKAGKIVILRN